MTSPVTTSEWIYCLNSFRFYDHTGDTRFSPDRSFTSKSYIDAIQNCIKIQSDTAISVSVPLQHTLCDYYGERGVVQPIRNYLDHLIQEMTLLSRFVPKRCTVSYLHWNNNVHQLLDEPEMTELMFQLNKRFSLLPQGKGRYVIELDSAKMYEGSAALLTGLGFNHACLATPYIQSDLTVRTLIQQVQMLRAYGFETVSTTVPSQALGDPEDMTYQLQSLIAAGPDTICVPSGPGHRCELHINQPGLHAHPGDAVTLLEQHGYTHSGCCKFSRAEQMHNWHIHDLLALGLSATSLIDNILIHNLDQLDQYLQSVDEGQLPFNYGGYLRA